MYHYSTSMFLKSFNTSHIHAVIKMTKIEVAFASILYYFLLLNWSRWMISLILRCCSGLSHNKITKYIIKTKIKTIKIEVYINLDIQSKYQIFTTFKH
jgi:hypothetical protein